MNDIETLRHIIGELNKELEEKKKTIARLSKRDDELKERAEKAEAISRKLVEFHKFFKENTKDDIPGNPYYCGKIRDA